LPAAGDGEYWLRAAEVGLLLHVRVVSPTDAVVSGSIERPTPFADLAQYPSRHFSLPRGADDLLVLQSPPVTDGTLLDGMVITANDRERRFGDVGSLCFNRGFAPRTCLMAPCRLRRSCGAYRRGRRSTD
jgi:hypothetical protein